MTQDQFEEAIIADITNAAKKLQYSDWLIEQGDPELAYAYRWSAKHNLYPAFLSNRKIRRWIWVNGQSWLGYKPHRTVKQFKTSILPELIYHTNIMEEDDNYKTYIGSYHKTHIEAMRWLAKKLAAIAKIIGV